MFRLNFDVTRSAQLSYHSSNEIVEFTTLPAHGWDTSDQGVIWLRDGCIMLIPWLRVYSLGQVTPSG